VNIEKCDVGVKSCVEYAFVKTTPRDPRDARNGVLFLRGSGNEVALYRSVSTTMRRMFGRRGAGGSEERTVGERRRAARRAEVRGHIAD
jgi:hypothetical protein